MVHRTGFPTKHYLNFDVLLTVRFSIFISVFNQLDVLETCRGMK